MGGLLECPARKSTQEFTRTGSSYMKQDSGALRVFCVAREKKLNPGERASRRRREVRDRGKQEKLAADPRAISSVFAGERHAGPRHTWTNQDCRKHAQWAGTFLAKRRTAWQAGPPSGDSAGGSRNCRRNLAECRCATPLM